MPRETGSVCLAYYSTGPPVPRDTPSIVHEHEAMPEMRGFGSKIGRRTPRALDPYYALLSVDNQCNPRIPADHALGGLQGQRERNDQCHPGFIGPVLAQHGGSLLFTLRPELRGRADLSRPSLNRRD
jgi:hypothetical protein